VCLLVASLQSYCINREQFDFVLDVTKFKSKGEWAEDPMKEIDTKTKSAFTRTFNKQVSGRC
jgi:replication factor C subunit 1